MMKPSIATLVAWLVFGCIFFCFGMIGVIKTAPKKYMPKWLPIAAFCIMVGGSALATAALKMFLFGS